MAALLLAAFYPVWKYCGSRWIANDETAACLPLLLILFMWIRRMYGIGRLGAGEDAAHRLGRADFLAMSAMLGIYILAYHHTFMLLRAIIALTVLGIVFSRRLKGRIIDVSVFGLLFLSLPAIPTAQFYFGYPLRVIVAKSSSALLGMLSYDVSSSGTSIFWDGKCISVDAPCSGIRMLYAGVLLVLLLGYFRNLSLKGLCLLALAGTVAVIFGNVVRATVLFFTETGIVAFGRDFLHTAIGISVFIWIAAGIYVISEWLVKRRETCIAV